MARRFTDGRLVIASHNDGKIDAREGMATTVFTVESLNLKSTYAPNQRRKGKGKGGGKAKKGKVEEAASGGDSGCVVS